MRAGSKGSKGSTIVGEMMRESIEMIEAVHVIFGSVLLTA
jgi:hypothetical protein